MPTKEEMADRVSALESMVDDAIKGAMLPERKACYWIEGHNIDGLNFCHRCAVKRIQILRSQGQRGLYLGGGPRNTDEHDSHPFCEVCCVELDGSLTDYGIQAEIDHHLQYGSEMLYLGDLRTIGEFLPNVDLVGLSGENAEKFDQFCSWLKQKLLLGHVMCPWHVARCKMNMVAVRQANKGCKAKRTRAKRRCPRLDESLKAAA